MQLIFICFLCASLFAVIFIAVRFADKNDLLKAENETLLESIKQKNRDFEDYSDLICKYQIDIRRLKQVQVGIETAHKNDSIEFNIRRSIYEEKIKELEEANIKLRAQNEK